MVWNCDDWVAACCRLQYFAATVVAVESSATVMTGLSLLRYVAAFAVKRVSNSVDWVAACCRLRYFAATVVAVESSAKVSGW
jgi:hypothetical protein